MNNDKKTSRSKKAKKKNPDGKAQKIYESVWSTLGKSKTLKDFKKRITVILTEITISLLKHCKEPKQNRLKPLKTKLSRPRIRSLNAKTNCTRSVCRLRLSVGPRIM